MSSAAAIYIPGVSPQNYEANAEVELFVSKVDSSKTQLPFDYYYLNYCTPDTITPRPENLGQVLRGDRIENSAYQLHMKYDEDCKFLCQKANDNDQVQNFKWMIDNDYRASWVIDNLPTGMRTYAETMVTTMYVDGFPLGFKHDDEYFLYNHAHIFVQVHPTEGSDPPAWRIVGALVHPLSISHGDELTCEEQSFKTYLRNIRSQKKTEQISTGEDRDIPLQVVPGLTPQRLMTEVQYSYSVTFEESDIQWTSRWDQYLYTSKEGDVHWLSIINSFAMVLFLSAMVGHILTRAVRRDIDSYNSEADLDSGEEAGWKQVRGEVFRPPHLAGLLAVMVGTGVQLAGMISVTLTFAALGLLSPALRGGLLTTVLVFYVFMGVFAGYTSGRVYKMLQGVNWKRNALATSIMFPGLCFCVFFCINLFTWAEQSSGTVPFTSLLTILLLWLGISLPLVFLGAAVGFRKTAIQLPCKVNRIPQPLKVTGNVERVKSLWVVAGSLPFGCMFIELSYLMKSVWHHSLFYYLFGFLFLCFFILLLTAAEISVLLTYMLLCKEDYRWWWFSASVAGSSGLYLFGYAVVYYFTDLSITRLSSCVLYFGYMFLASTAYALVTGTTGFLATLMFVRYIYSAIKLD
jgi:transmembrane 9 superfamily protein 2/4